MLRTCVVEAALAERLREATVRGRPFGGEGFAVELERKVERRLRPLPVGRPRKKPEEEGGRLAASSSACNCGLELVFECTVTGFSFGGFFGFFGVFPGFLSRVSSHGFPVTGFHGVHTVSHGFQVSGFHHGFQRFQRV